MSLLLMLAATTATPANDYARQDAWLCRPGRRDVCEADLAETLVTPTGAVRLLSASRARPQDVDCFYVYPTVSLDPTPNSDMHADRDENGMTIAQFAPFRSVCRPFAPLYRQVTLTALRKALTGGQVHADFELPYRDVRDAFRRYLAHDNGGRPFVLIGHSQGSMLLRRLVAEEIDGKPLKLRLLSAILPGTAVMVPIGKDVGGTFNTVPLCRAPAQTGCVVTWASYRSTETLPANARFGTPTSGFGETGMAGQEAGCTNPVALPGGRAPLDAILGFPWWRGGVGQYQRPATGWSVNGRPVATRFVRMPGLLTGECTHQGSAHYLSVTVTPGAARDLAETVIGKAAIGDEAYLDWGFHVVDMAIVEGDLVRLVRRQVDAFRAVDKPH
jgi:hypothetical protein